MGGVGSRELHCWEGGLPFGFRQHLLALASRVVPASLRVPMSAISAFFVFIAIIIVHFTIITRRRGRLIVEIRTYCSRRTKEASHEVGEG